jgi:redox-sensitive bicupin YhaK (pirin superfamily)
MRGFQLWINLPATEKMKPAGYRDIPAEEIPVVTLAGGGSAKVVAGTLLADGVSTRGPIQGLTTDPLYVDVSLPAGARFEAAIEPGYHAFVYPFEGSVDIGADGTARPLRTHQTGVLAEGDRVVVKAGAEGGRFLLLAGRPLLEPIVQYGPFVMNTREEIEQAIRDYQNGALTSAA